MLWLSCHFFFSCESREPWGTSLSAGAGSSEASERALHTGDERESQSRDVRQGEAAQGLGVEMQAVQTHAYRIRACTWVLYSHSLLQMKINLEPLITELHSMFLKNLTRIVTHKPRHSLVYGLWLALMIQTVEYHWHRILSTLIFVLSFVCLGSFWIVATTYLWNSILIAYSLAIQKQSNSLEWPLYRDGMEHFHGTLNACYISLLLWSSPCKCLPRQLLQIKQAMAQTLLKIAERFSKETRKKCFRWVEWYRL